MFFFRNVWLVIVVKLIIFYPKTLYMICPDLEKLTLVRFQYRHTSRYGIEIISKKDVFYPQNILTTGERYWQIEAWNKMRYLAYDMMVSSPSKYRYSYKCYIGIRHIIYNSQPTRL